MVSWLYDPILQAQQRNANKQARLLASRNVGRGRTLQPGDLAYVIERGLPKESSVTGPFAVGTTSGGQVHLHSTRRVLDQEVRYFSIHRD